jgi:hypothetical protein
MAASLSAVARVATHGHALTFEDLETVAPATRVRAGEQTLLRVVAGTVGLTVAGVVRLLTCGEEAIIGAGEVHSIECVGGPARILTGFRPAPAR